MSPWESIKTIDPVVLLLGMIIIALVAALVTHSDNSESGTDEMHTDSDCVDDPFDFMLPREGVFFPRRIAHEGDEERGAKAAETCQGSSGVEGFCTEHREQQLDKLLRTLRQSTATGLQPVRRELVQCLPDGSQQEAYAVCATD